MIEKRKAGNVVITILLILLVLVFLFPILIVVLNSFKGNSFVSTEPFALPSERSSVGFANYITGLTRVGFFQAFGYSMFITVFSTALIVVFTAMTAWYLVRMKNKLTSGLYYAFVFSMVVPFQMVMFTMANLANVLKLDNPVGILFLYLGFGSGLSVFMYAGFVKSVPLDVEEAATIDGAGPLVGFFRVVFPIMKSTTVTIAILNAMWIWNDYLLPYLVIGRNYKTLPVAVQAIFAGSYGNRDMGALMAMLVLSIIPIIIFYLFGQKHIIKGVLAGAVKG